MGAVCTLIGFGEGEVLQVDHGPKRHSDGSNPLRTGHCSGWTWAYLLCPDHNQPRPIVDAFPYRTSLPDRSGTDRMWLGNFVCALSAHGCPCRNGDAGTVRIFSLGP